MKHVKKIVNNPSYEDFKRRPGGTKSLGELDNIPDIGARGSGPEGVDTWFLGPKAENQEMLAALIQEGFDAVCNYRKSFHPEDPPAITEQNKASPEYLAALDVLKYHYNLLVQNLNEYTTPYFSRRYQGHMLSDTTIPGFLGYFAAMLHNPNNVTVQASTLTTFLGMAVGEDLCEMIGFDPKIAEPWAHITADGSIANIEAMWATRELKYLPVAIRWALQNDPDYAAYNPNVRLLDGSTGPLIEQDSWTLLNLKMGDILDLPGKIAELKGIKKKDKNGDEVVDPTPVWQDLLHKYSLDALGWFDTYRMFMPEIFEPDRPLTPPAIIAPQTMHYSWPKAAAVLGIGDGPSHVIQVEVDADARMNIEQLRYQLDNCLRSKTPVLMVVAVTGSTEEGACDPLDQVLELRDEFRTKGMEFNVHADAAWGGYIVSTVRKDFDLPDFNFKQMDEKLPPGADQVPFVEDQSKIPISSHTAKQLMRMKDCDSVTVDPHKCGYIQYPAGAICYADTRFKNLVTFGAPVIGSPGTEPSVGEFGLEGSKPGAAAAAIYLSHAVIRPSVSGYGKLLSLSLLNTKLFYLHLLAMGEPDDPFVLVPLPRLPSERNGGDPGAETEKIRKAFIGKSFEEFTEEIGYDQFKELGPDENIIDYTFNLRYKADSINDDFDLANELNLNIYNRLHVQWGENIHDYDLLVTQTQMGIDDYGEMFLGTYLKRIGIKPPKEAGYALKVNRTVVMDPWLNEKLPGGTDFFATIFGVLRQVAKEEADKLQKK